jgi:hypothetical protein
MPGRLTEWEIIAHVEEFIGAVDDDQALVLASLIDAVAHTEDESERGLMAVSIINQLYAHTRAYGEGFKTFFDKARNLLVD